MLLHNKNILIGVTGSIAIYKVCELIRFFVKEGAHVKIVMTYAAQQLVTPLTFEALSGNQVLLENSQNWSNEYNHIHIGKWADLLIIAPATANTINKIANGIADNLVTQIALAYPRIKLLAPSANLHMLQNPITQASIKLLKLCNYEIAPTQTKELICKEKGDGAMADPRYLFDAACAILLRDNFWADRNVVVSAGGTIERIDDIRFISNFSSGKMGVALAKALFYKGANVCLIKTKNVHIQIPSQIHCIEVENSQEMFEFITQSINAAQNITCPTKQTLMHETTPNQNNPKKPFFFSVAAVSDFVPIEKINGKIKKDSHKIFNISLQNNRDILSSINKTNLVTIGFKAEMDLTQAKQNGKKMLLEKNLDAVCLNLIDDTNPFGGDTNTITLFTKNHEQILQQNTKLAIALELLEKLQQSQL